ncbi:MAG: MerC domain-containing protein [Alphaproteobacteria bacterium]|jgi:hypothetical protein|nr:MerC domain-containing protein [Alphaproteobacteria bacterium]
MAETKAPPPERLSWLGSATSLLAVATCYGTMAAVALLSVVGVSVEINEGVFVKVITALLVVAVAGTAFTFRRHRNPGPLLLSIAAAGLLLWVFYGSYSFALEIIGFVGLVLASIWDFRAKRRASKRRTES